MLLALGGLTVVWGQVHKCVSDELSFNIRSTI